MFFISKRGLIKNEIVLASVHIPKTAGTSFRKTLKTVYGDEAVARLDIPLIPEFGNDVLLNESPLITKRLSGEIKVVHGHFSPELLKQKFKIPAEVKFITWVRDPVDRVISNFYYLEKRLREELDEEKKGLNILSKMQRTLLEYAAAEVNQNRMSKFLKGHPLAEFHFVGIQEYMSEDIRALSRSMCWSEPPAEYRYNITGSKYNVSEEDRQLIGAYNQQDMELYAQATELREERMSRTV